MKRTTYGMRVYAVGGNRNAAEIAGINAKNDAVQRLRRSPACWPASPA